MDTTPGRVSHVAINAGDVEASRAFYEAVFGWSFSPHLGRSDFLQIRTADGCEPGPFGVLQARRDVGQQRVTGFECTVSVEDLEASAAAAQAAGGRTLTEPFRIPGVGTLVWLQDPDGNVVGAMQYEVASE